MRVAYRKVSGRWYQVPAGIYPDAVDELPLRGLGDVVESIVKPIARALKLPCLDKTGNLRPDSGCAKRRDFLNKAVPLP